MQPEVHRIRETLLGRLFLGALLKIDGSPSVAAWHTSKNGRDAGDDHEVTLREDVARPLACFHCHQVCRCAVPEESSLGTLQVYRPLALVAVDAWLGSPNGDEATWGTDAALFNFAPIGPEAIAR